MAPDRFNRGRGAVGLTFGGRSPSSADQASTRHASTAASCFALASVRRKVLPFARSGIFWTKKLAVVPYAMLGRLNSCFVFLAACVALSWSTGACAQQGDPSFSPSWRECVTDADCTVFNSGCYIVGINRSSGDAVKSYREHFLSVHPSELLTRCQRPSSDDLDAAWCDEQHVCQWGHRL